MDLRWRPLWAGSWLRWSLVRRCRMMWSLLGCHGLQALKAHCRISVLADHAVLVLSMAWFAQALKTPWKFENCWISVKSPWIFHRSPWMFLKVPWIKITFVLKKTCFAQRNDWKHSNTQIFLGEHEKSFLMISVFLAWFIFRYLTYPFNRSLLKEGFAISDPPSTCAF